jgi:polyhydroxybutyrate depolymerase
MKSNKEKSDRRKMRSESLRAKLIVVLMFPAVAALISFQSDNGRDKRLSFRHDNLRRRFIVYTPGSFEKSLKIPVVIVLHGRGSNGKGMMLVTKKGFNRLADKDGFLVVYPDGIELNWNDGRMDEEAHDRAHRQNIDDVGFISALIDFMIDKYKADPQRIYVTGISNGAIMSYRLACELSDRIAAIAPVDGNIPCMLATECSPSHPVSVLAINNMLDPLVPYSGGEIYNHDRTTKLGKVLSVKESVGFWVEHDGCSKTPVVNELPDTDPKDGTRVTRTYYKEGRDGTEVMLYSIDRGGHTWPGGFQYLPERKIGKTSRDINADEVIWSFFKTHSLAAEPVK